MSKFNIITYRILWAILTLAFLLVCIFAAIGASSLSSEGYPFEANVVWGIFAIFGLLVVRQIRKIK